jgi:hypothetical protein
MAGHADNMHVFGVRGPANEANFFTSGYKDTAVGALHLISSAIVDS